MKKLDVSPHTWKLEEDEAVFSAVARSGAGEGLINHADSALGSELCGPLPLPRRYGQPGRAQPRAHQQLHPGRVSHTVAVVRRKH